MRHLRTKLVLFLKTHLITFYLMCLSLKRGVVKNYLLKSILPSHFFFRDYKVSTISCILRLKTRQLTLL